MKETLLDKISNHFVLVLRDYFINHFLKENKNLNLQRQPSLKPRNILVKFKFKL